VWSLIEPLVSEPGPTLVAGWPRVSDRLVDGMSMELKVWMMLSSIAAKV
jgi:hypothetical protein